MCFHADMVIPIPRVHLIKLRSHFHILNITFEHKIFGILNANFGVSTPILAILASLLGFLNSNFFHEIGNLINWVSVRSAKKVQ